MTRVARTMGEHWSMQYFVIYDEGVEVCRVFPARGESLEQCEARAEGLAATIDMGYAYSADRAQRRLAGK